MIRWLFLSHLLRNARLHLPDKETPHFIEDNHSSTSRVTELFLHNIFGAIFVHSSCTSPLTIYHPQRWFSNIPLPHVNKPPRCMIWISCWFLWYFSMLLHHCLPKLTLQAIGIVLDFLDFFQNSYTVIDNIAKVRSYGFRYLFGIFLQRWSINV